MKLRWRTTKSETADMETLYHVDDVDPFLQCLLSPRINFVDDA